jgi:hypothetical protein
MIYLALSYPGSLGVQYLERRMRIGYRRRRPPVSPGRRPGGRGMIGWTR